MQTLMDYQGSGVGYNDPLRAGHSLESITQASHLAGIIWDSGCQVEHEALFRGICAGHGEWSGPLTIGQRLTDPGFMSTSSSYGVAAWFATDEHNDCGTVVKILNGKDFPAAQMPNWSCPEMKELGIESEEEYLLPPGMSFRVEQVHACEWNNGTYRFVEVTALPPTRPPSVL